jgi:hypothetical protein
MGGDDLGQGGAGIGFRRMSKGVSLVNVRVPIVNIGLAEPFRGRDRVFHCEPEDCKLGTKPDAPK